MFGCLSIRRFYHALMDVESRYKNHTMPPTSLLGQIMWRDFYYAIGYATPNFNQMKDNRICLQAEWQCPEKDESNSNLVAWRNGKTGFPFIDAIMTQLREEGWIHHLARQYALYFLNDLQRCRMFSDSRRSLCQLGAWHGSV
jgi:cryptochrome